MTHQIIPVTQLSEDESWALLAGQPVGRLATSVAGRPDIYPVNYVLDDHTVVFKTERGSKLLELTINDRVAFEVDDWREGLGGWSVVCRGQAEKIEDPDERERAEELPLHPWVPTPKTVYVRIVVDDISGRSFRFNAEEAAPGIELGD
ncbi:pyridoxamine 5'-phosphate oxidase family protein [Granulicoccus sp. GXG6511]|uniref:pyridoxamine 5'-phosphate oxidase family protein n=1 Tax=Granulicoccus sp. GXG6511 TaxID=3381351 RepID=UPI003D7E9DA2